MGERVLVKDLKGESLLWVKTVLFVGFKKEKDIELKRTYQIFYCMFSSPNFISTLPDNCEFILYRPYGFVFMRNLDLNFIHIEPKYRNKGFGQKLLSIWLDVFLKSRVLLHIQDILEVNKKWFFNLGFTPYKEYEKNGIKYIHMMNITKKIEYKKIYSDKAYNTELIRNQTFFDKVKNLKPEFLRKIGGLLEKLKETT